MPLDLNKPIRTKPEKFDAHYGGEVASGAHLMAIYEPHLRDWKACIVLQRQLESNFENEPERIVNYLNVYDEIGCSTHRGWFTSRELADEHAFYGRVAVLRCVFCEGRIVDHELILL